MGYKDIASVDFECTKEMTDVLLEQMADIITIIKTVDVNRIEEKGLEELYILPGTPEVGAMILTMCMVTKEVKLSMYAPLSVQGPYFDVEFVFTNDKYYRTPKSLTFLHKPLGSLEKALKKNLEHIILSFTLQR